MKKNPNVKYASRYIGYALLIIGVISFFYGLISDRDLVFEFSLILMIDGAILLAEADHEKLHYDEKQSNTTLNFKNKLYNSIIIVLFWTLVLGVLGAGITGLIYGNLNKNLVLEYSGFLITLAGSAFVIIISSSE